jgi:NADPH2:quinone reductase
MKAIVVDKFGGPQELQLRHVPIPEINDDQLLIKVAATSVNYADIQTRKGLYHAAGKPPLTPGLDVAGTIEQIGANVTRFIIGQRVIAFPKHGSYAEYVVADENLTYLLPDTIDWISAAACPVVAFTSYKLLADVGRLQAGESVLIHAASGGIGTTCVQLAKLMNASMVIGTVGSEKKSSIVTGMGANAVIVTGQQDFAAEVMKLTNENGVDVVLDSIAGAVTRKSLDCLARYGRLVNFGNAGGEPGVVETRDLHASCRAVLGFSLGTTRNYRPELLQVTAEKVLDLISRGLLNIMVGQTFPLEEAMKAHELIESRQHTGKIVLTVDGDSLS